MIRGLDIAGAVGGPWGGALAALLVAVVVAVVVAVGGMLAARRWRGLAGAAVPAAVLAGWVVLVPRPVAWVRPHAAAEHLLVPAAVLVVAALLRGRVGVRLGWWLGLAGVWFGAWWVAGAAGAEFWRALAGGLALTLVLRWRRDWLAAGAAVLCGGVMLAGGPAVLVGEGAVLAGAFVAGGEAALLALAVVAAEVGAGRLARGRVGVLEWACLAAIAAPFVAERLERIAEARGLRRPWLARAAGVAGAAALGLAVAWGLGRWVRP